MFKKIIVGFKRSPRKFILAIVFGYSALWTALEPIFTMLSIQTIEHRSLYMSGYLFISIVVALISIIPKKNVTFRLTNTNTTVVIKCGDLFEEEGHKVIPVNEYFDSLIGNPVAAKSVHGIFIEKILGGHSHLIDTAEDAQLAGKEIDNIARSDGKRKKYPIGSTITINHSRDLYFLFALCNSDHDCKASCNPSLMLTAMEGLWKKIRIAGNGTDINLPLIGSGLSGIGLPPSQLLQLILISLLKFTKENELSCTVKVILLRETFDMIDLDLIKNNWQ